MKKSKTNYINRELSWLEFNQRVLDQSADEQVPLLERLKFLAISAANLDEFMMVRVGGLQLVEAAGDTKKDIAGMTATQQLSSIRGRIRKMYDFQSKQLQQLQPMLAENGIRRQRKEDLSETQLDFLRRQFTNEISAALAPLAVENSYGFPLLSGARLCLCVRLRSKPEDVIRPKTKQSAQQKDPELAKAEGESAEVCERFALLPVGRSLNRIWAVPGDKVFNFMYVEEVLAMFLSDIFGGQEVLEAVPFRITRNGDVSVDEDNRSDLLIDMQEMLKARETSHAVRLEICDTSSEAIKTFLRDAVEINEADVYPINGPLALSDLFAISGMKGFNHLKDSPWPPQPVPELARQSEIFDKIALSDRVLIHPYQSYQPVIDFLRQAAEDPQVIAIKQTLYRTSKDSEIALALERAAENGKHVTCIVELKARFDEARNIQWAKRLEHAGVDVIYGIQGLKTHAKVCIVVRKEISGIRRYVHFGTGNYNESTAKLYSDVSFFTCDEQLGIDAIHFFNAITGLSVPQSLGKLAAAPINLRETVLEMIAIEIENARKEGSGEIIVKLNSLVDKELIDALYQASQAGVDVKLNVRGICCLLPGRKGLSENVRVVSIVDRLLEHARVFYFRHGGDDRLFISSADWMGRNLDRRVELMVPIEAGEQKSRLINMLNSYFEDNTNSSELQSDGTYELIESKKKKNRFRSQEFLYKQAHQIYQAHTDPKTTVFQPIRGSDS
jgi:polyphosphate kinase